MAAEKLENRPIKEFPPREYGSSGETVFDNRVHIRDANSGRLVIKQHYAKHSFGKTTIYERPIGSGNMWNHDGTSLGNWAPSLDGAWIKKSDKHKEAPAYERVLVPEDLAQRNTELEMELAALKADLGERTAPASVPMQAIPVKQGKA